jgi:hypothetical protein
MNKVWAESKQEGGALLVLLAMADNAGDDCFCFPGTPYLAKKARLSVRQTQRVIDKLISERELKVAKQSAGRGKRTIYKIFPKGDMVSSFNLEKGDICDKKRVTFATPSIIREPSLEPPSSSHAKFVTEWCEGYAEAFDGDEYAFQNGKDAKAAKALLTTSKLLPEELMVIARKAWANPAGFYCKSATSISGFFSKFNEIRQELKNGKTTKGFHSASSRNAGTANEGKSKQYEGVGRVL